MRSTLLFAWCLTIVVLPLSLPVFEFFEEGLLNFWIHFFQLFNWRLDRVLSDSLAFWLINWACFIIFTGLFFFKKEVLKSWSSQIELVVSILLSFVLLKYGLDKIYHLQFPKPEINLLQAPLSSYSKDLLFWTTAGTSSLFNLLIGWSECLLALGLLFKPTRGFSRLFAVLVFALIFGLNLSFDIDVKSFSLFLLFGSLVLAWPLILRFFMVFRDRKEKFDGTFFLKIGLIGIAFFYLIQQNESMVKEVSFENYWLIQDNQSDLKSITRSKQGYLFLNYKNGAQRQFPIVNQSKNALAFRDEDLKMTQVYLQSKAGQRQLYLNGKIMNIEESKIPQIEDRLTWIQP